MKAVLKKSHVRKRLYHTVCGSLKFPPEVVITRWKTWLQAAFFYVENFSTISDFGNQIVAERGEVSVLQLKEVFKEADLEDDLFEVSNFKYLCEQITAISTQGLTVQQQLNILDIVKKDSALFEDEAAKLESIGYSLEKNTDIYFFEKLPVDEKIKMKYAPLTSVDVERSFSQYKYFLSDRRYKTTEENLAKLNCIQFNRFVDFVEDS